MEGVKVERKGNEGMGNGWWKVILVEDICNHEDKGVGQGELG